MPGRHEYPAGDGRLKLKYSVDKNEIKQGKSTEYFRNGTKFCETFFKDGKKNGEIFIYNQDGSVKQTGEYKNDKKHGFWNNIGSNKEYFYIDGKECKEEDFKLYTIKERLSKENK